MFYNHQPIKTRKALGARALKVCEIVFRALARDCHFRRQLFAHAQRHDAVLRRINPRRERTCKIITTNLNEPPALVEAPGTHFGLIPTLQEVGSLTGIRLFEQRRWRWMVGKVEKQVGWYYGEPFRRRNGLVETLADRNQLAIERLRFALRTLAPDGKIKEMK